MEALIGVPQKEYSLEEPNPLNVGMRWSYSPGDTHFRCRVLLFRDGKVAEKHAEFYVDSSYRHPPTPALASWTSRRQVP